MQASQQGHLTVMQALLAAKADVNAKNDNGVTALMVAAGKGHLEVVRALLDAKAEVNAKNDHGVTALSIASQLGHLDVMQALLAANAEPAASNGQPSAGTANGGGSTFTYRRTPSGTVTSATGTIAPGAKISSEPGSPLLHVDRVKLTEGSMIITDKAGKAITLRAGMTIEDLELAAKAAGANLERLSPTAIKVFSSTLHFENGHLSEIENP